MTPFKVHSILTGRWLRVLGACFFLAVFCASAGAAPRVAALTILPWDLEHNPDLGVQLRQRGLTHATYYLPWIDIEPVRGQFNFSAHQEKLDRLISAGLDLVLVLDMGGRPYFEPTGKLPPGRTVNPEWVSRGARFRDFDGQLTSQPDFTNPEVREAMKAFVRKTTRHFAGRYKKRVLGFAIGLQEEHEIKYGQEGYRWRDYGENAKRAFATRYGASPPVVNYNVQMADAMPRIEPNLPAWMTFREERLAEATCDFAKDIRAEGQSAMAYFGELFTSHDAIYGVGVVERLSRCIDIAVIDFNFFDGYDLKANPTVLPLLANYLSSLGYKRIMAGAYAENWSNRDRLADVLPAMTVSLTQAAAEPSVIGFEIGGLRRAAVGGQNNDAALPEIGRVLQVVMNGGPGSLRTCPAVAQGGAKRQRVAILASTSNFYLWHGERSGNRNIHQDALHAAFRLLKQSCDFDVHVIGERNLLDFDAEVKAAHAILVPHQAALPESVRQSLVRYWKQGGVLIQDMRLGEFDPAGRPRFDWLHEVFGIKQVGWQTQGGQFVRDGVRLSLPSQEASKLQHAMLVPQAGFQLRMTDQGNPKQGLIVRGPRSLVFGFVPQLYSGDIWAEVFLEEIRAVVSPKSGGSKLTR